MALSDDASGLAGIGVSAATGNYLGAAVGAIGLGMSLFGGISASENASQAAEIQGQIAGLQGQVNTQKYNASTLMARRQTLEQMRTAQRTGAQATAAATGQNAQFGSGLAGGLGQIQDQSKFNLLGINQNQEIQKNVYGLNQSITADQMQLSALGSSSATDQGLMSLGSGLMSIGGPISRLSQGVGSAPAAASSGRTFDNLGSGFDI